MGLSRIFCRRELFERRIAVLEAAGRPLDMRELAQAGANAKGLDGDDRVLKALALSIVNIMVKQARRGQVANAGRRLGVRVWI